MVGACEEVRLGDDMVAYLPRAGVGGAEGDYFAGYVVGEDRAGEGVLCEEPCVARFLVVGVYWREGG